MAVFETAMLARQQSALAVQEADSEISHSTIRIGIGQIAAIMLQTQVITGGPLFLRRRAGCRDAGSLKQGGVRSPRGDACDWVFAAGDTTLAPRMFAQVGPTVWKVTTLNFDMTASALRNAVVQQRVMVARLTLISRNWNSRRNVTCSWTAVSLDPVGQTDTLHTGSR